MAETLYAVFHDPNRARVAADELVRQGVQPPEISLLLKEGGHVKSSPAGVDMEDTRPTTPMRGTEFRQLDPMGDDMRQLSVPNIEQPLDVEINPALSDYPGSPRPGSASFSSAPPAAERDFNPGIESDNYNRGYEANVVDDTASQTEAALGTPEDEQATPYEDMPDPNRQSLRFSRGFNAMDERPTPDIKVDPDADAYRDTDIHQREATSVRDITEGASQGAAIGLGVGAVAALATLLVPGIGLVIGAGALATAATALAAGAGVGALAGGISGWLQENGIPAPSAQRYASAYDRGGAILAVTLRRPEMTEIVEEILQRNGAAEIERHQAYLA